MVQKIAPYFFQWKIESGKWKIVLNNFQLSIIHFPLKKAPLTDDIPQMPKFNKKTGKISGFGV